LHTQQGIVDYIKNIWTGSRAWPELVQAMRLALSTGKEPSVTAKSLSSWTDLPGLCCQAAGGHLEWADDLTVAWLLFYSAAHLMDKVQDQDEPDPWWKEAGSGAALSTATGLFFSASLALNNLYHHPVNPKAAPQIVKDFYNCFLVMASGQYSEFTDPFPSIERYWKRAAAKSGGFFALACRSAARLVSDDSVRLGGFERYGYHLGLIIQIRDDLDDVRPPAEKAAYGQRKEISGSLAVVYALSVLPSQDRKHLQQLLREAPSDSAAAGEVIGLLNQSNASLYIVTEIERHRQLALESIQQAVDDSQSRESLENFIWKL
jgi:geranylgeranyl pyrophosphate synthase